jgi:hypothetical protein
MALCSQSHQGLTASVALSLLCESLALSSEIEEQAILASKEVVLGILKKVNLRKSYGIFPDPSEATTTHNHMLPNTPLAEGLITNNKHEL